MNAQTVAIVVMFSQTVVILMVRTIARVSLATMGQAMTVLVSLHLAFNLRKLCHGF